MLLNLLCLLYIIGTENQDNRNRQLETRQAITSIGVVTLFILGHSLRIFLNFFEVHYEEDIMPAMKKSQNKGCISHRPFWNNVSSSSLIKIAEM